MTIPNEQFIDGIHKYQIEVFKAFDSGDYRFFMMEWHRRARKTTLAINLLIRECCRVANSKYVYVAPTQVMARNIVWDDPNMLRAALPAKTEIGWAMNEQKMLVKFANGSMLKIGGSDNPDSLRGIDAIGVVFDEWALIKEEVYTEIFRPIIAGSLRENTMDLFRWAMFLYTPKGINHATMMFDKACCFMEGGNLPDNGKAELMADNWFVSRLDGEKSGIMTDSELKLAKNDMPVSFYDQEIKCSRITEEERTLITTGMLERLKTINWDDTRACIADVRRIVAIDPAFGGDICVLTAIENGRILETKRLNPHLTNEIIFEAKMMAANINTENFIVDCIGNGKGVADGLSCDVAGYNVQYFNSAESPTDDRFANKKAEAWFMVAEKIKSTQIEPIQSAELWRQIPKAAMYKITSSGKLIMQPKDDVKKLLGCSPDDADSFVMGMYGIGFTDPVNNDNYSKFSGVPNRVRRW